MLSLGKRFWFCGSHHYYREDWDTQKNNDFFGESQTRQHGHNYELWIDFIGKLSDAHHMIMPFSEIKTLVNTHVISHYDHRHFNHATWPFSEGKIQPELGNLGVSLFDRLCDVFSKFSIAPRVLTLKELSGNTIRYSKDTLQREFQVIVQNVPLLFIQNGHTFRQPYPVRISVWINSPIDEDLSTFKVWEALSSQFTQWADLKMSQFLDPSHFLPLAFYCLPWWSELHSKLSIVKLEIQALDQQLCYEGNDQLLLSVETSLNMAHRLFDLTKSQKENLQLFGPCAQDHGHDFRVIGSYNIALDQLTDPNLDLSKPYLFRQSQILSPYQNCHLNHDCPEFSGQLLTCELLIMSLSKLFSSQLSEFSGLELYETPNNRFLCVDE